MTVIKYC